VTIHWALLSDLPPAPPAQEWLGPAERRRLEELRIGKRRVDWLLGRLAAKRLVTNVLADVARIDLPLDAFDIAAELSGAPAVRLADGRTLPVGVSISHSDGTAFCAAWAETGAGLSVGADIERLAPRTEGLVRDFFGPAEIAVWETLPAGPGRDAFASAVWSAKESVLKALRLGLTADTRSVRIALSDEDAVGAAGLPRPEGGGWKGFAACCVADLPGRLLPIAGFRREMNGFVMTMAVAGAPQPSGIG
jgi:phosphopantetheinyl transferase